MDRDDFVPRDLELAFLLLQGSIGRDGNNRFTESYLEKNEPLEIQAREAIVRLLRSQEPLDRSLREMLAGLFEPAPDSYPGGERRIVFEFRKRGNRRHVLRDIIITRIIYEKILAGRTVNKAVECAIEDFGLERDQLMKMWSRHREDLEKRRGKVGRPAKAKRKSFD